MNQSVGIFMNGCVFYNIVNNTILLFYFVRGTISAFVMQGLSIYFTYGLQCYMPIIILLDEYIIPALNKKSVYGTSCCWNLTVRLSISLITCKEIHIPIVLKTIRGSFSLYFWFSYLSSAFVHFFIRCFKVNLYRSTM